MLYCCWSATDKGEKGGLTTSALGENDAKCHLHTQVEWRNEKNGACGQDFEAKTIEEIEIKETEGRE